MAGVEKRDSLVHSMHMMVCRRFGHDRQQISEGWIEKEMER
jgi:hypothetical protein